MSSIGSLNIIITLLGLAAVVLSAHYLSEIRDIARETRDIQRKLAERLGAFSQRS